VAGRTVRDISHESFRNLTLAIFFPKVRKTVKTSVPFAASSLDSRAAITSAEWLVRILPSPEGMTRIRTSRLRKNGGFSVTEMIVALSVAGVVASLAMPASGHLLDRYRLSSAVSQFKMEVGRARMQAIGQNRFVRIKSESWGYVREVSSDGVSYIQDESPRSLPKGVTLQFGSGGGPKFNRQGIAGSFSFVQISNSQGFRIVVVNILGRVEVL